MSSGDSGDEARLFKPRRHYFTKKQVKEVSYSSNKAKSSRWFNIFIYPSASNIQEDVCLSKVKSNQKTSKIQSTIKDRNHRMLW